MWSVQTETVDSGTRYRVSENGALISFRELFGRLETAGDFAVWYGALLATSPFAAFYWEHPPLTSRTIDRDAEFVLIESASLARIGPDPSPFAAQFASQPDSEVFTFPNLGGDARLIVPRPVGPLEAYPHLASFVRHAPQSQVLTLWRLTAEAVRRGLSDAPLWLSTAGLGVAWLHLRLDTRPKYYRFQPYARQPSST